MKFRNLILFLSLIAICFSCSKEEEEIVIPDVIEKKETPLRLKSISVVNPVTYKKDSFSLIYYNGYLKRLRVYQNDYGYEAKLTKEYDYKYSDDGLRVDISIIKPDTIEEVTSLFFRADSMLERRITYNGDYEQIFTNGVFSGTMREGVLYPTNIHPVLNNNNELQYLGIGIVDEADPCGWLRHGDIKWYSNILYLENPLKIRYHYFAMLGIDALENIFYLNEHSSYLIKAPVSYTYEDIECHYYQRNTYHIEFDYLIEDGLIKELNRGFTKFYYNRL